MKNIETREDAIKYLKNLDERLHYIETCNTGFYAGCMRDVYHQEKKMKKDEIEGVLGIVKQFDLPMAPINTDFGFEVGFTIYDSDNKGMVPDAGKECLTFLEKQLPNGYDFQKLSEVFLSDKNKELLMHFGLDKHHDIDKMSEKHNYTY